MIIRKAAPKDVKAIAHVLSKCYNINGENEGIEVYESELSKNHHYLIAEEDDKIVGIVTWISHGLPKHMLAELDRIAVLPEFRGKGIAEQLKGALIEECKSWFRSKGFHLRKLYLLTHQDNAGARKFYEKMGFSHETTLKEHYYKGRDECVYSKFFEE